MKSQHVNDQPDLSFVYAIHHALTEDAERLAAAVADLSPLDSGTRIPAMRQYFAQYESQLVDHHTHEDEVFFPALAAKVGAEAMALDRLEAQHQRLGAALDGVVVGLNRLADPEADFTLAQAQTVRAAQTLVDAIGEHLALEESVAFPLYRQAITVCEHAELEARVQAMGSMEKLMFMVPWLFDRLPGEVRAAALAQAPEFFSALYADHVEAFRELAGSLRVACPN